MTPADTLQEPLHTITEQLLAPARITRALIQRGLRRARRYGEPWRTLTLLERALLKAAAAAPIETYNSESITGQTLARIIAKIETHTMRGRTLLTALKHILTHSPGPATGILGWARRKLDYLLYLGRSLLAIAHYYPQLAAT